MSERQPWERMEDETNRWYHRFEAFRLLGVSRSLNAAVNQERVAKGRTESRHAPGSWRNAAEKWRWYERAEAWDQHLIDEKEAAIRAAQEANEAAWKAKIMGPTETLARISDHGRNDMREFFKIATRWTENPSATEEIIGDEKREVPAGNGETEVRTFYQVRKIVFNVDALLDPEKSHRVKKFVDSPKNGLGIELYNADDAAELMAKHHKLLTDNVDVNMYANTKGYQNVSPDDWDTEGGEDEPTPPEP